MCNFDSSDTFPSFFIAYSTYPKDHACTLLVCTHNNMISHTITHCIVYAFMRMRLVRCTKCTLQIVCSAKNA